MPANQPTFASAALPSDTESENTPPPSPPHTPYLLMDVGDGVNPLPEAATTPALKAVLDTRRYTKVAIKGTRKDKAGNVVPTTIAGRCTGGSGGQVTIFSERDDGKKKVYTLPGTRHLDIPTRISSFDAEALSDSDDEPSPTEDKKRGRQQANQEPVMGWHNAGVSDEDAQQRKEREENGDKVALAQGEYINLVIGADTFKFFKTADQKHLYLPFVLMEVNGMTISDAIEWLSREWTSRFTAKPEWGTRQALLRRELDIRAMCLRVIAHEGLTTKTAMAFQAATAQALFYFIGGHRGQDRAVETSKHFATLALNKRYNYDAKFEEAMEPQQETSTSASTSKRGGKSKGNGK